MDINCSRHRERLFWWEENSIQQHAGKGSPNPNYTPPTASPIGPGRADSDVAVGNDWCSSSISMKGLAERDPVWSD